MIWSFGAVRIEVGQDGERGRNERKAEGKVRRGGEKRSITLQGWKGSGSLGSLRLDRRRRLRARRWRGGLCLRRRRPWRDGPRC